MNSSEWFGLGFVLFLLSGALAVTGLVVELSGGWWPPSAEYIALIGAYLCTTRAYRARDRQARSQR